MVFNSWHHFPTFIQKKAGLLDILSFCYDKNLMKQKDHCCQKQWSFYIQAINL